MNTFINEKILWAGAGALLTLLVRFLARWSVHDHSTEWTGGYRLQDEPLHRQSLAD
jgi:hypothetical protein